MRIKLLNDWKYLFSKDAIGGRFAAFTFINIGFIKSTFGEVNGFYFTLMGLGVRIYRSV